jgi:hypothetical protein
VSITVDTDYLTVVKYEKDDNKLTIHFVYGKEKKELSLAIDCKLNTIITQNIYYEALPSLSKNNDIKDYSIKMMKAVDDRLFVSIHGFCTNCRRSQTNSNDILIDLTNNKIIYDNSIQSEHFYLSHMEDNFHVSFLYHSETIVVSRYKIDQHNSFVTVGSVFYGKMIECDLTNQQKLINKLKTLLIFS